MPRKTLEDYFYTFKKAERIIDIKEYLDCKMGVIRKILKDKLMQNDTEQFFCLDEEFLKGED